jgi:hypothetical protein
MDMEKEIIELIVDNTGVSTEQAKIVTNEIIKLHLQSQIDLLGTVIEHPNKPNYKRHDVLDKMNQLKKKLYKKRQI